MSAIRVAIQRGRGAVSKLIQWQTRSPYSHASLLFGSTVIEAREFKGVRWLSEVEWWEEARGCPVDLFEVEVSEDEAARVKAFGLEQVGKAYDYLSVARFVSRRKASRRSEENWFCSELVFAAFAAAGVRLLERTEAWEVSPGLLARSPFLKYEKSIHAVVPERSAGVEWLPTSGVFQRARAF